MKLAQIPMDSDFHQTTNTSKQRRSASLHRIQTINNLKAQSYDFVTEEKSKRTQNFTERKRYILNISIQKM